MNKGKRTVQDAVSSKAGNTAKAERRAAAMKKAKRKKLIAISIGTTLVVLFFAFVVYSVTRPEIGSRVYAAGPQSVTLYDDGRFSFVDCRFVRTGRFSEIVTGDSVTLEFVHNNRTVRGSIWDEILTIPTEWDAGKGHSPHLILQ